MEWTDELRKFRESVEAIRRERSQRAQAEDAERDKRLVPVRNAFEALGPRAYLDEMNRILLEQRGEVSVFLPWDPSSSAEEVDEDDDDIESGGDEVASAILTWEEDGQRELVIDIGLEDDRIYWQVNGEDVATQDAALREALMRGFAEEIDV